MFLARGFAYVYFIYGTAHCINVVGDRRGVGAAVLIRALEPLVGIELMAQRRGERSPGELARGPGRLAQALGIDRTDDGQDLCARGPVWLADDGCSPTRIGVGVRIGLTKERDRPLRFFVPGSRFVSGPRALSR